MKFLLHASVFLTLCLFSQLSLAQKHWCFGTTCENSLELPESAMRAKHPNLGSYLTYSHLHDAGRYKLRYYNIPQQNAFFIGTELHDSLPDYSTWGAAVCGETDVIVTEGDWQFRTWVSNANNVISSSYEKDISVAIQYYQLTADPNQPCVVKTAHKDHIWRKYEQFSCLPDFTVDYGGSAETDYPVCTSALTSFVVQHECFAPYSFDQTNNECRAWCPPDNPQLDTEYGMCRPWSGKIDEQQCAETVLNPINVATGTKLQTFSPDYQASGAFPLQIKRSYSSTRAPEARREVYNKTGPSNSSWRYYRQPQTYKGASHSFARADETQVPNIGYKQWRHNYDYHLFVAGPYEVSIQLANGKSRRFFLSGEEYTPDGNAGDGLEALETGWMYYALDGKRLLFNETGQLTTIKDTSGEFQTLSYNSIGQLASVAHNLGGIIHFSYNNDGLISQISAPDDLHWKWHYDDRKNLTSITFPDQTSEVYHYENAQFPFALTGITDAKQIRYASWEYDHAGRAISSTHADGADAGTISYSADGSATTITNVHGKQKVLSYVSGNLKKVTGDSCDTSGTDGIAEYNYDYYGKKLFKKDEAGNQTNYGWDTKGRLVTEVNAASNTESQTTKYQYDGLNTLPDRITTPNGAIIDYTYDSDGKITQLSITADEQTRTTSYLYNEAQQLISIDGPRSDVLDITSFEYNTEGRISRITDPNGLITEIIDYDNHNRPIKTKDTNNVETQRIWNFRGQLLSETIAGQTTTYQYDSVGQLTRIQSAEGQILKFTWDDARRLTHITNSQNQTISLTLDKAGNITQQQIIDATGKEQAKQSFAFDSLDRLTQITDASNNTWTRQYDILGNLVKQINPQDNETTSVFDALRRTTQSTAPLNTIQTMNWNQQDQLTSVIDALGRTTNYSYNGFGELISQSSPDTGLTKYTWDEAGNLASKTDASGITVSYSYDAGNRLTSINYPNAANNIVYQWDSTTPGQYMNSRISHVTDESGSTVWHYNAQGRITQQQQTINGATPLTLTSRYSWDGDNNLTSITLPSGKVVQYTRDSLGQIIHVALVQSSSTQESTTTTLAENIQYKPFGPLTSLVFGNGKTLNQQYDKDYLLTSKQVNGIIDKNYVYDSLSNLTTITDNQNALQTENYQYDSLSRLLQAQGVYGNRQFEWDNIGNRTEKITDQSTTPYTITNGRLSAINGVNYKYDANGNLIQRGDQSFFYNQANRLHIATVDGVNWHYRYNHAGQRVKKFSNNETQVFHYHPDGTLAAQADGNGIIQAEYIYLNGRRLAIITDQIYYLHTNHLDAPLAITDQQAQVMWQASYTPFGEISIVTNNIGKNINVRFPGQRANQETGLYYNWFRDYDPEIGRYIQSDPIGLSGGINTYNYVNGNPVNFVDPDGQLPVFLAPLLIKGLIGGASTYVAAVATGSCTDDALKQAAVSALFSAAGSPGLDKVLRKYGKYKGSKKYPRVNHDVLGNASLGVISNAVSQIYVNSGFEGFSTSQAALAGIIAIPQWGFATFLAEIRVSDIAITGWTGLYNYGASAFITSVTSEQTNCSKGCN